MSSRTSRGPVLLASRSRSRSRSSSVRKSSEGGARRYYADKALWGYVLTAVVVLIVIALVIGDRYLDVHAWARLNNTFLLGLLFVFAVLMAAYATYVGHRSTSGFGISPMVMTVAALFVVIAVLLILTAWLVYRSHNYVGAFYVSLITFILALVHMWLVWRVNALGGYAAIPLVLLLAVFTYILWYMADESSDCLSSACAIFETP